MRTVRCSSRISCHAYPHHTCTPIMHTPHTCPLPSIPPPCIALHHACPNHAGPPPHMPLPWMPTPTMHAAPAMHAPLLLTALLTHASENTIFMQLRFRTVIMCNSSHTVNSGKSKISHRKHNLSFTIIFPKNCNKNWTVFKRGLRPPRPPQILPLVNSNTVNSIAGLNQNFNFGKKCPLVTQCQNFMVSLNMANSKERVKSKPFVNFLGMSAPFFFFYFEVLSRIPVLFKLFD